MGFSFHLRWFTHIENHHYRGTVSNFDLHLGLTAIEQRGSFVINVPHLLWHRASVYMIAFKDPWHLHLLPSVLAMDLSSPLLHGCLSHIYRPVKGNLGASVGSRWCERIFQQRSSLVKYLSWLSGRPPSKMDTDTSQVIVYIIEEHCD